MFGQSLAERGARMEECITVLRRAWSGERFDYEGRTVHVTPPPLTPGGPLLMYGGGSRAAARRAARFGMGFFAQAWSEGLEATYREECARLGHDASLCFIPPPGTATSMFVADDVDRAWDELGPYLMHDVRTYASWNEGNHDTASVSFATTVDELRAENRSHRILSVDEAADSLGAGSFLPLHPLVGGLPPDIAWRYLELAADVTRQATA